MMPMAMLGPWRIRWALRDERKKMQHKQKRDSSLHYAKLDAQKYGKDNETSYMKRTPYQIGGKIQKLKQNMHIGNEHNLY